MSLESWNFLEDLGVPLSDMNLPIIRNLLVSAPNGKYIQSSLPLGGFGISRYTLDHLLARLAQQAGVTLMEGTKVSNLIYRNNGFMIFSSAGEFESTVAAGAYGKRGNLDVKWKRQFTRVKPSKLNHHVGVKYHVRFSTTGRFNLFTQF